MSKSTKAVMVFAVFCMLSSLIAWLAGYNFDHRGVDVAVWAFITVIMAALIGAMTVSEI